MQGLVAGGLATGLTGNATAQSDDSDGESSDEGRPNILLLCGEDVGTQIEPYDTTVETPHIREFASESLTYDIAWSNNPQCAPARTTLATGMYANSLGAQHMRSQVEIPDEFDLFHQQLAADGYTTVNHGKTDYNVEVDGETWTSEAGLEEAEDPFYMQLNYGDTHEGTIFGRVQELAEQGAEFPDVSLPDHYPDTENARRTLAAYHEQLRLFDEWVGEQVETLRDEGLWEDTVVIVWGDHGPGIPRAKRSLRNEGLHVPVIAHVPERYRDSLAPDEYEPGARTDRPISFVDFAPTFLSLAGIEPPEHMQGEPFMGEYEGENGEYVYGFRSRGDERMDMRRTVRNGRYQLIRNYMPHRVYGQFAGYPYENPMISEWRHLASLGQVSPEAASYFEERPPVELYDLEDDPQQLHNLADDPEHQDVRHRLTAALHDWQREIRDTGFLPEDQMHTRPADDQTIYEYAQSSEYKFEKIRSVAETAADRDPEDISSLQAWLDAKDPAVRYWAATGLLVRRDEIAAQISPYQSKLPILRSLHSEMKDEEDPSTRVVLAETVASVGSYVTDWNHDESLETLLSLADSEENSPYVVVAAWNSLDLLDRVALPKHDEIADLSVENFDTEEVRSRGYNLADVLKQKTVRDLSLIEAGKSSATWDDWPEIELPF